jgi:hypothetical protein
MRYKYHRTEGCLPCGANSVSKSESSSFEGGETAWKAGTLPAELLPQNRTYFSPKMPHCQRGVPAWSKMIPDSVRLVLTGTIDKISEEH